MDLTKIDWALLCVQKRTFVELLDELHHDLPRNADRLQLLSGLLNFIDAFQDDAESRGYPIVFDREPDESDQEYDTCTCIGKHDASCAYNEGA